MEIHEPHPINLDQQLEARQQPDWPDPEALASVLIEIRTKEPLVDFAEVDQLRERLALVEAGEAIVLQEGPCAESFNDGPETVKKMLESVILPNFLVLAGSLGIPVVKIGRLAGQYGKPRSSPTEERDGQVYPSFRGEIVNAPEFDIQARQPNPQRMLNAYDHSQSTLATLRSLARGGFADLRRINDWNVQFAAVGAEAERERYSALARQIGRSIDFMEACGVNIERLSELHEAEMYISHEALLLEYEMALIRESQDGRIYDASAHMLWIGERTRALEEAHIAFAAEIENPVGVKIGPSATPEDVIGLCERLNPNRIPGKLTLIPRMGANRIRHTLPPLLRAVQDNSHRVVWLSDPMHGNTISHGASGKKTREFNAIVSELKSFIDICRAEDVWPGGIHLEVSGDDVTECLGGNGPDEVGDLSRNYTSNCDPRLNPTQTIELAFMVAEMLQQ